MKLTAGATKMLYKFIWLLLQICITIFQNLRLSFQRFLRVNRSYDPQQDSQSKSTERENAYLGHCKAQLNKLPRHLSLIIGPNEQIKGELITRILKYALKMNIGCISFYDTRLSGKQRIRLHNLREPKGVMSKSLGDRHLLWTTHIIPSASDVSNGKTNISMSNGFNGKKFQCQDGQSIEIYEIEASDGRAMISDVCCELFSRRQSNEIQNLLQNRTLLSQRIDKDLSKRLWKSFDPELCIIFSKHMCMFGMLPWHTRFTEFYLHQQEDLFDAKTFAKILFQYSRCEQRWGK